MHVSRQGNGAVVINERSNVSPHVVHHKEMGHTATEEGEAPVHPWYLRH